MITEPYLIAFLKGLVEALTEFLPVSSTGHLFLMNFAMHFPATPDFAAEAGGKVDFMDFFDIFIQFGAILAVLVEYRKSLWQRFVLALKNTAPDAATVAPKAPPAVEAVQTDSAPNQQAVATPAQARRFWLCLVVGTLPILAVGFALKDFLNGVERNPAILLILAAAWICGGLLMWLNEARAPQESQGSAWDLDLKSAFAIGLFQCIAMWPGISRSAATIIAGRRLGLTKQAAAEFSFFLAVPALTAASAYKLLKYYKMLNGHNIGVLLVGTAISFVGAWLAIRLFLAFLRKFSFTSFAIYRILLGLLVAGLYLGGWRTPGGEPPTSLAPVQVQPQAQPVTSTVTAAPRAPGGVTIRTSATARETGSR